jgi:hypothetical protein
MVQGLQGCCGNSYSECVGIMDLGVGLMPVEGGSFHVLA